MTVRLVVNGLRQHYIHVITLDGIRDKENSFTLVHPTGFYTLNNIPEGTKLSMKEVSIKNTSAAKSAVKASGIPGQTPGGKPATPVNTTEGKLNVPAKSSYTYEEIKPLLVKYTCVACHNPDKKQVGPGFIDIAKRNYSPDKIMQLIKNPQPKNWPEYATPMAPMPQVPSSDARKIAIWINSLDDRKQP